MTATLAALVEAIVEGDEATTLRLLDRAPGLAAGRADGDLFFEAIVHYVYVGDTALHVAAAAYRPDIAGKLIGLGARIEAANRRGAQPLHYAADGHPASPNWNPLEQARTIETLLAAGADPNAADRSGTTPLHRAVRTRCAEAVRALLAGGADPLRDNGRGSTPVKLAGLTTGRGGSGSTQARAQQAEIQALLGG